MALDKVFASNITRTHNVLRNNLYDLLSVDPVAPLPKNETKNLPCDFTPKTDKYFVPKKKLRLKVKTVRDIRNLFEKDVFSTLECDLEKQQNVLFRKIRVGSSKHEKTKILAKNMLNSDKPLSKASWQMLINVNPNDHAHPTQYLLWNGKCIQVNGSRGGKSKFICKFDLAAQRESLLQGYEHKKSPYTLKRSLLRSSLNVKFRPGPLSRKKKLDLSYQKYSIGSIQLAKLPNPGLHIIPEYGKALESSITSYLNALRDVNGLISDKWAEFAVSTLGKVENGCAVQINKKSCVTFDLKYKYDQRHLLMRYDDDKLHYKNENPETIFNNCIEVEESITGEVMNVLDKLLISVEISLLQNNMYTGEDPPRVIDTNDTAANSFSHSRDKLKKHGELNRLDVTVIRLSDTDEKDNIGYCHKSFCKLGCICESLFSSHYLKNHCGKVECMFVCKCGFTKYNLRDVFEDDVIPGLVNFDKEYNQRLSKEEQKFHQTVVLSGEKSILLKSKRRDWKAPKRYADFYSGMCLKTNNKTKRFLSVVELKLNCANIEPWCMVHNLYKCFCKGKFTEKLPETVVCDVNKSIDDNTKIRLSVSENQKGLSDVNNDQSIRSTLRPRVRKEVVEDIFDESHSKEDKCARAKGYEGRKYSDIYYLNANRKIIEMEENDMGLRKRISDILGTEEPVAAKKMKSVNCPFTDKSSDTDEKIEPQSKTTDEPSSGKANNSCNEFLSVPEHTKNVKIKSWLEPLLKMYRQRYSDGFTKKGLDPPRAGKVALYPWDFILQRYREGKNFFLVTKDQPYRTFMSVDNKNALFKNCINISEIKNIEKYSTNVKNFIKNDIDSLKDHLCILRGLQFCWELIGSIKKLCDHKKDEKKCDKLSIEIGDSLNQTRTSVIPSTPISIVASLISQKIPVESNIDKSKWFVMTLENDFSEIQFYNRGFFVKYDSIIKAINVARASDKTVRLSSNKCADGSCDPQFGIYAIPNANEDCVFIGPYEQNEPLGIETVKIKFYCGTKRTRGVWITTNKVDNSRVIDNPLSFMRQINKDNDQILLETIPDNANTELVSNIKKNDHTDKTLPTIPVKIKPKPIKIAKTNNFYHLTPFGILKQTSGPSSERQDSLLKTPTVLNKGLPLDVDANSPTVPLLSKGSSLLSQSNKNQHLLTDQKSSKKPIAEIAPQVKVVEESTESNSLLRMSVLKPEEINKRSLLENKIHSISEPVHIAHSNDNTINVGTDEMTMDIENFLANSVECSAPSSEVLVISDEEDYCNIGTDSKNIWNDVGIVCKNIENIGWIPGRQDPNKHLSFEFPGFKYTEFYPEEEAMRKIRQVLSRKVYVSKHLALTWSVTKIKDLKNKRMLKQEDLAPNLVLTKQGLVHKFDLIAKRHDKRMDSDCNLPTITSVRTLTNLKTETEKGQVKNDIIHLEAESNLLEEESKRLLGKLNDVKSEHFSKISNNVRQQINDRLQSIISNSNM